MMHTRNTSSVIVENLLYKETNQGMNDFLNKKN